MGYISYFGPFNYDGSPMTEKGYIQYSWDFLNFLSIVPSGKKIVAIYAWLPKCKFCKAPMIIESTTINHKINVEYVFYVCKTCRTKKSVIIDRATESAPIIRIHIIVKSFVETPEYLNLVHEKIYITFSKDGQLISGILQSRLDKAVKNYFI